MRDGLVAGEGEDAAEPGGGVDLTAARDGSTGLQCAMRVVPRASRRSRGSCAPRSCSACASAPLRRRGPSRCPPVPRFAIAPSPIGLRGDVRPHQYLGVVGPRSAWLGTETGEAELWVHPLKLASRLPARLPDPRLRRARARERTSRGRIEVRPEATTITYTHATFTVRQHILAPLDEPGLLVLLDVDTYRPLEIVASFRTVFQYAWPGGARRAVRVLERGGAGLRALGEPAPAQRLLGSPWATTALDHPAHALPDAPSTFTHPGRSGARGAGVHPDRDRGRHRGARGDGGAPTGG